jgi:Domain of unknown function (DUF4288)
MNWFLVKLVYRFICGGGAHAPEFSEQLRLVAAEDILHAFHKARLIGERETTDIISNGLKLKWKFIDVCEILPIEKNADGAEVWSCMNEEVDAEMYIRDTQQKSKALLQEAILQFNNLNVTTLGA